MSITSISGAASSLLSQITNSQQTQAASAVSMDEPDADTDMQGTDTGSSATGNSLTGTMGASLDNQTLQALLNLTQQDPTQDASGTTAQGTQAGQHHHHHHGAGKPGQAGQVPGSDPTALASTDPTALDPLDGDDDGQDGLTALLTA